MDTPQKNESMPREQQYASLLSVRNTELKAYWTRYSIQSALNLGVLIAALSSNPDSIIGKNHVSVAIAGIVLALIWLLFTYYGKLLLTKRWEEYIIHYEKHFPEDHRMFTRVHAEESSKGWFRRHLHNLDIPAWSIPVFVILGWIIVAFTADASPQINKDPGSQGYTPTTIIIALANVILVCVTACSLWFAGKANARAERLYVGQNRPLIDVTPIGISQNVAGTHATTIFSIVNYSGFKAYNIGIDLKYGDNSWILEWIKARDEKTAKGNGEGVVRERWYLSSSNTIIREIDPGETKESDEEGKNIVITGSLNLESDVCAKGNSGLPVLVRVTWQNLNHHVFDEVHQYRLICTKDTKLTDPGGGRAFTFIPEGIVSKKSGNTLKGNNND
jgi:hypothetical protein